MTFKENKRRVRELLGIDPDDRRYNTHHVLFKSDFKKREIREAFGEEYRDSKANLFPLPRGIHNQLHDVVNRKRRRG